ncbi:MAG: AAA family ATPase [Clostridia bacterium]|nr:AAA family ATPase [Clostridia bacterium]
MKIKSIYVKQFGCLKEYRMEFREGFNIVNKQNEYGKTTIAEFIFAMLYGMKKNARNIRENTRKRYLPWGEKSMDGEITVSHDGKSYIITRKFGAKKGDDTVSVIDEITGERISAYETDEPMFAMTGVGADAFLKVLYINHFYIDMAQGSDEIMDRLINLTQTGEENISYNRATEILDKSIKELNGRTGKIKQLKDKLDLLYIKINNVQKDYATAQELKKTVQELKAQQKLLTSNENKKENRYLSPKLIIIYCLLVACAVVFAFIHPALVGLPVVFLGMLIVSISRQKEDNTHIERLMAITEHIARYEEKIKMLESAEFGNTKGEIDYVNSEIEKYNGKLNDLLYAKKCLDDAFTQLQQGFGVELNNNVSEILSVITDDKYDGVKVSGQYEMMAHNTVDGWQSAEYLSDGAFDQIYFSLKMALVKMLFPDMPLILDDAFVRYDKTRLKRALEYLINTDNQIILFSCNEVGQ